MYLSDPKYLAYSSQTLVVYIIGLTIWWYVTMLPFVLLVTPPMIRAVAHAFPSIVPEEVRKHSLKEELPGKTLSLAILLPGLIILAIGLLFGYTTVGSQMLSLLKLDTVLVQWMFYISGIALTLIGLIVRIKGFNK
jgi:hypothetical protein